MPKISVVTSAYNHGKYIGQAIESVLGQTETDFDYIICDDASTDNTASVVKTFNDPRLKLVANEHNSGSAVASLRALERATGNYIVWFSADDVLELDALAKLRTALDEDSKLLAVAGLARFIGEEGQLTGENWTDDGVGLDRFQLLNKLFYQRNVFCCPAFTVRREALDTVGYFPPHFKQIGDQALWTKLLFMGDVKVLPDQIVKFRIRDNLANGSAETWETLSRFDFEISELLELFAEKIESIETLIKIFPEAADFVWPQKDALVQFFLAHIALQFPSAAYKLFGLRLMHRMMADRQMAKILEDNCNFTYADFFNLTGNTHIFKDHALRDRLFKAEQAVEEQSEEIERASKYLRELEHSNQELLSSASWKLTAPLRLLRARLRRE
jgi:glycosyltransferase involved in cell wall biosynthesis